MPQEKAEEAEEASVIAMLAAEAVAVVEIAVASVAAAVPVEETGLSWLQISRLRKKQMALRSSNRA